MFRFIAIALLMGLLASCISIEKINADFRTVDRAWALENQENEKDQRIHLVNASFDKTYAALKQTFIDLSMPIDRESPEKGFLLAKNQAPKPLSVEQWEEVRKVENPKLRKLVGGMITIQKKPTEYIVTFKAEVENEGEQSRISLDYYLEMPKYEDMGLIPTRQAPPYAVKLVSEMFWSQLDKNIAAGK